MRIIDAPLIAATPSLPIETSRRSGVAHNEAGGQFDVVGADDIVGDHLSQGSGGHTAHLE